MSLSEGVNCRTKNKKYVGFGHRSQPRYDMTGHWKWSDRGQRSCLVSGEGPGVGRSGQVCHDNSLLGNKKLQSYQHTQLVLTEIQPTQ